MKTIGQKFFQSASQVCQKTGHNIADGFMVGILLALLSCGAMKLQENEKAPEGRAPLTGANILMTCALFAGFGGMLFGGVTLTAETAKSLWRLRK